MSARREPRRQANDWHPGLARFTNTLPPQITSGATIIYGSSNQIAAAISQARPAWLEPTVLSLARLLNLAADWDSYGAPAIEPRTVQATLELLRATMRDDSPAPATVPMSSGGVQVEWHEAGLEIEVRISARGGPWLVHEDLHTGHIQEADLSLDLGPLTRALDELATRSI